MQLVRVEEFGCNMFYAIALDEFTCNLLDIGCIVFKQVIRLGQWLKTKIDMYVVNKKPNDIVTSLM